MTITVFISYSSVDNEKTLQIVDILTAHGFRVWFDQEKEQGIEVGEELWKKIVKQIYRCDVFVYLLTNDSIGSEWCKKEFMLAQKLSKSILPVVIRGKTKIPASLSKFRNLDTSTVTATAMEDLCKAIEIEKGSNPPIGRTEEWQNIKAFFDETYCTEEQTVYLVIHGRGGIGKTTLINRFIASAESKIQGEIYRVEDCENIHEGVRHLARKVGTEFHEEIDVQEVIEHLKDNSIIFFEDLETYAGYEILLRTLNKYFYIIATEMVDPFPRMIFSQGANEIIKEIFLDELSSDDSFRFIEDKLSEPIKEIFAKDARSIKEILARVEYKSPFYINTLCDILEHIRLDYEISNAVDLLNRADDEISRQGLGEEKIVGFPFARICEYLAAFRLVMASSLFLRTRIPEEQLLVAANIELDSQEYHRALELAIRWGFLHTVEDKLFNMSSIFHMFVRHKFEEQNRESREAMKRRFVQSWLKYIQMSNAQTIWEMSENVRLAIKMINEPEIINDQSLGLESLTKEHLFSLHAILGFKERRRFLARLLEDERNIEKIAYIFADLADGYIRAGKFITAEGYALHSLRCYEQLQLVNLQVYVLRKLGTIYRSKGEFDKSITEYLKAADLCDQLSNQMSLADVYRHLAQTYLAMGSVKQAYNTVQKSVALFEHYIEMGEVVDETGDNIRNSLAYALNALGNIELTLGRLEDAERHITQAVNLHAEVVGRTHFYTGYDLLYLAKVQLALGKETEAIKNLEENRAINSRFFGLSPNLARSQLALAEAHLQVGDLVSAKTDAQTALTIFSQVVDPDSPYIAYAHRILAEIYLHTGKFTLAKDQNRRAEQILLPKFEQKPYYTHVKLVDAQIKLAERNISEALATLWQVRTEYVKFGMRRDVDKVEKYLLNALLQDGIDDWNDSVEAYKTYLLRFPQSLHNQLGERLVSLLLDEVQRSKISEVSILDVFCGTGLISQQIARHSYPKITVIGVDGSPKMIAECRQTGLDEKQYQSFHIPGECEFAKNEKYRYITLHMGIFQIDLRARHFLFQQLLPFLHEDCVIFLSTYAADFNFPRDIAHQIPGINEPNGFKPLLLRKLRKYGGNLYSEADCLRPVFTKENLHSLSSFFELYGFDIEPTPTLMDILTVRRIWEDRLAFTEIPVISRKAFAEDITSTIWRKIEGNPEENYSDNTYGLILKAKRRPSWDQPTNVPMIFSHYNVNFSGDAPIQYAVAGVLKNDEGKVLLLKRGTGSRDFQGSWSLPSTFVDEGVGLKGSLKESLGRNLGIEEISLSPLEPLSIRFSPRKDQRGESWIIAMCLFTGRLFDRPKLKSEKYDDLRWVDDFSFIDGLQESRMGDCMKSYRDIIRLGMDKDYG